MRPSKKPLYISKGPSTRQNRAPQRRKFRQAKAQLLHRLTNLLLIRYDVAVLTEWYLKGALVVISRTGM